MRRLSVSAITALALVASMTATRAFAQDTQIPSPGGQTNLDLWNYIVGVLMPVAVALVTQAHWDSRAQSFTMIGLCILAGFVTCYFQNTLDVRDVSTSIIRTVVAAIATYYGFWKPTGFAPHLQQATSTRKVRHR